MRSEVKVSIKGLYYYFVFYKKCGYPLENYNFRNGEIFLRFSKHLGCNIGRNVAAVA